MVDLQSASDTTLPKPSRRQPLVDRGRFVTDAWWPFIDGLFRTLRSAVGAVQETVDQLAGVWTLSVNNNNRVTGQIKLDGSAALTEFSVLADKFIVVHPSVNGTTITAFVVGLVNGVSTVGINGNLLVDGTIVANAIAANAITAEKIVAGAVGSDEIAALAVTDAELADAAVVATKIAANAVVAGKIAANAVTAAEIAAGSVTATKIDVSALSAISADIGECTAGVVRSSDSKFIIDLDNKTLTITT